MMNTLANHLANHGVPPGIMARVLRAWVLTPRAKGAALSALKLDVGQAVWDSVNRGFEAWGRAFVREIN